MMGDVHEDGKTKQSGSKVMVFQDVMSSHIKEEEDISLVFFELANAEYVGYKIYDEANDDDHGNYNADSSENVTDGIRKGDSSKGVPMALSVVIKQDVTACGEHTGGIVWETAYLLLQFLKIRGTPLGKTLEVGAGCGMLGQALVAYGLVESMIMTETDPVMPNLVANIERNREGMTKWWKQTTKGPINKHQPQLVAYPLDWTHYKEDCLKSQIQQHSMDTIVGTDVIFTTTLVEPLLQTLRFLSHERTEILLCVQERCKDSHQLLLKKARDYDLVVENISDHVTSVPNCEWGADMECRVFKFTIMTSDDVEPPKKKKKKQRR